MLQKELSRFHKFTEQLQPQTSPSLDSLTDASCGSSFYLFMSQIMNYPQSWAILPLVTKYNHTSHRQFSMTLTAWHFTALSHRLYCPIGTYAQTNLVFMNECLFSQFDFIHDSIIIIFHCILQIFSSRRAFPLSKMGAIAVELLF